MLCKSFLSPLVIKKNINYLLTTFNKINKTSIKLYVQSIKIK